MAAADDASSVALLRGLRSGAVDFAFVHRIDVCSAAPEDLIADLEPVPGTDLAEDGGYSSIWYFYCPKKFKNAQGKQSGHRQRAIAGGETCWHSETRPKPVKGMEGATICNLSYGCKDGSSRSFNRMGWCMTEYDDKESSGDHVLCKVHRSSSSLAKGKLKPSSSSTQTAQRSSGSKRKETAEHPQAPPMKMSYTQPCADQELCYMDHQVQEPLLTQDQMTTMATDYDQSLFPAEELVQPNDVITFTVDELLGGPGYSDCPPLPMEMSHEQVCADQELCYVDHQQLQQEPLLTQDQMTMTMPVAYDQSQFPAKVGHVQPSNMFACTMNDLWKGYDPKAPLPPEVQLIMDEFVSKCCGPPTSVAPPDDSLFEGVDELLGSPVHGECPPLSPNTKSIMDDMFGRCYDKPTGIAPHYAGSSAGLAF